MTKCPWLAGDILKILSKAILSDEIESGSGVQLRVWLTNKKTSLT